MLIFGKNLFFQRLIWVVFSKRVSNAIGIKRKTFGKFVKCIKYIKKEF